MKKKIAKHIIYLIAATHALLPSAAYAQSVNTGSNALNGWLQLIINVLSAAAGIVFVFSFIFAGYQYMTARDNAQQVSDAKNRIVTLVITFILFAFGYAILQWLVPGGIFS